MSAVHEIIDSTDKIIDGMRQMLVDRGLDKVPHGIGWGLGSELDFQMTFFIKPAVYKLRDQHLRQLAAKSEAPHPHENTN